MKESVSNGLEEGERGTRGGGGGGGIRGGRGRTDPSPARV